MTDTIFEDAKQIFERMSYDIPKEDEDNQPKQPIEKIKAEINLLNKEIEEIENLLEIYKDFE